MDILIETAIAAAVATIVTELVVDLGRIRRTAAREEHRANGTGPYAPTHDLPRDVDLALEIADHLRLKYREVVELGTAINRAWREAGLRAATLLASALQPREETT